MIQYLSMYYRTMLDTSHFCPVSLNFCILNVQYLHMYSIERGYFLSMHFPNFLQLYFTEKTTYLYTKSVAIYKHFIYINTFSIFTKHGRKEFDIPHNEVDNMKKKKKEA